MQDLVVISQMAIYAGIFLLGVAVGQAISDKNQYCRRIRISGSWLESYIFAGTGFLTIGLMVRYFVIGNPVN